MLQSGPMTAFALDVLGGFRARLDTRPLAFSKKSQALLAYLALSPGRHVVVVFGRSGSAANSVSFAAKRTRRPQVTVTSTGSSSEFGWLPTKMTGPAFGT